jgi:TrmH family RNA methyltransferase
MADAIKRYKKDYNYSYALGTYPTREILKYKPELVRELILSSKKVDDGEIQKLAGDIPVRVDDKAIERLTSQGNCYSVAVFDKYSSELDPGGDHVVLVNPEDMGNVGTIMRTMMAFNYQNLALISPAVDVFNPRVVRTSMGSLFPLNFEYFDSFEGYQEKFGGREYYAFLTNADKEVGELEFKHPHSLVFGNESDGLPASFEKLCTPVSIYQSELVDSLNLAVAAGIALHAARK